MSQPGGEPLDLVGTTADRDPARIDGVAGALMRLFPALEAYHLGHHASNYPPYRPGTVDSELIPLPEDGVGLEATIAELATAVEHGGRISAPGFVGFITTGATTSGVLAQTAITAAGGQRYLLHAFNALEWTGLRWLAELCGLPARVHGVFTSGGSTAQLIALGAARQWAFERRGIDVAADGLPAGVGCRVYVSDRSHRTVHRSAAVLGLGRQAVIEIPSTRDGRVEVAALDRALKRDTAQGILPIVVAVAGSTDTGSVDLLADVVAVARRHGAWLHIDGAYGLIAHAAASQTPLFAGVEEADSWIVDPHKWLATGVGVGAVYVRDSEVLTRAFAEGEAAYLEGSFSPAGGHPRSQFDLMGGPWADQGVELSSPPRGAVVWAALREIGRSGVARRVERHCGFARRIADRARAHARLELLCDAQLSVVCFRYAPLPGMDGDSLTGRILSRLRRETRFIPTSTRIQGALAIRPCFINPRTTLRDVEGLVDAVLRFGDELSSTSP